MDWKGSVVALKGCIIYGEDYGVEEQYTIFFLYPSHTVTFTRKIWTAFHLRGTFYIYLHAVVFRRHLPGNVSVSSSSKLFWEVNHVMAIDMPRYNT